jgi:hypothetical protein
LVGSAEKFIAHLGFRSGADPVAPKAEYKKRRTDSSPPVKMLRKHTKTMFRKETISRRSITSSDQAALVISLETAPLAFSAAQGTP